MWRYLCTCVCTYVSAYVRTYVQWTHLQLFWSNTLSEVQTTFSFTVVLIYSCFGTGRIFVFRIFFDFFGVGNPLDVVFVRILRFVKKMDHATRLLAVFYFRWTNSQPCTPKSDQTSILTKVVLCWTTKATHENRTFKTCFHRTYVEQLYHFTLSAL